MRWFAVGGALVALLSSQPVLAQLHPPPKGPPVNGIPPKMPAPRMGVNAHPGPLPAFHHAVLGLRGAGGFHGFPALNIYGVPIFSPWFGMPQTVWGASAFFTGSQPIIVITQPFIFPIGAEAVNDEPRIDDPDRFIVVRPDKPKNVVRNKLDDPLPPARVQKKAKEVDLGIKPGELPLAAVDGKGRLEMALRINEGRAAFGEGQYGLALERFRRACASADEASTPYFLLAQAQFATGKFDDSIASIIEGMKREPGWPLSPYQSRGLYRGNPAAYDAHLQNLRDALAAHPDDPRLLFLLGVQLWFDGQRDAAKPLFERAVKLATDPASVLAFLKPPAVK